MKPWDLMKAWAAFAALRIDKPDIAARKLRQSQYFITCDMRRFAPVRLLDEYISCGTFENEGKNGQNFKAMSPEFARQGWHIIGEENRDFTEIFELWEADCLSFGSNNYPRNSKGKDPKTEKIFICPAQC